ncbi:NACHT, LRR and PYD domains-containing protein 3-like [Xenentodon cancila]
MDHSEDREEEVPSSKSTSPGENEDQSKAQRTEKERPADQPLLQDDKDPEDPDDPEDLDDPDDPAVSAETINKIRPKFVNGVSIEILKQLIDLLLSEGVLSRPEKEDILEKNQTRADKARDFIDCVTKKGPEACRMMLKHLQSKDPTLFRHLGLYLDPTFRKGLLQTCQRQLKSNLTNRLECVFEGTATRGNSTLLNDIYTELFITEGETTEVNNEHEVRRKKPTRTVMTKGVAGIGKTVLVQKFTLDFRPSLDFLKTKTINDPRKTTSVKVLLTSLIRGNLLPSARVWITTRPAAANQIPPEYVDVVTEVRGFTDPQKEEYFRKRFRDESSMIISHIRTSRSIHIMCHIPVFCWITATVLEDTKLKKIKYDEEPATDPESRKMMEHLGKLAFEQLQKGHLIFYQSDLKESGINVEEAAVCSGNAVDKALQSPNGHLDLFLRFLLGLSLETNQNHLKGMLSPKRSSHDVEKTAKEQPAGNRTFISCGVILLEDKNNLFRWFETREETLLYQIAVDKALQSPNGHLDLFLRFLLGLSLETNQTLLRGLLEPKLGSSQNNQETVGYIKTKISEDLSAEKSINLFHCLNELNEGSLVEEVQQSLRSGRLSTDKLSPAQWSALVFILLSSEEDLEVFDLKKYSASEEVLLRLLPVVKASKKVLLSGCNLSEEVCAGLSSVLSSQSSSLTELDLSNNHLQDSGLEKLCPGLESPHCKLESLRLSGCLLTSDGCASLVSALSSNPSHLRELDLSYNHPGESAVKLLSAGLEDPRWRLDTLRVEPAGPRWLRPGLRKYSCQLSIDTNTVNKHIKLSDNNMKMTLVEEDQSYPDHPDRFDYCRQLLCREVLTGRCYWEVQRSGDVCISVSYRRIRRKGNSGDCLFGGNDHSWSLFCSDDGRYSVCHNNRRASSSSSSSVSDRVAVYVDVPAGTLSFYSVSYDRLIHLMYGAL